jgi:prophage maintenance system killer protein
LELTGDVSPKADLAKLEGALLRPVWRMQFEGELDVIALAISLASSIAHAHAFVDGNKRTAYVVLAVIFRYNEMRLLTEPGDITLAQWIERIVIAGHGPRTIAEECEQEFAECLRSVVEAR